jgi:hypothetical protein
MKFIIQYKKKIPKGYIGSNAFASKAHNIPFNHKRKNVIEIVKGKYTSNHEKWEYYIFKYILNANTNMSKIKLEKLYQIAHRLALKLEKIQFPKNPRQLLIQRGFIKK